MTYLDSQYQPLPQALFSRLICRSTTTPGRNWIALMISLVVIQLSGFGQPVVAETPLSFNRDVRPILSDKCFFCHGPDQNHRGADLRLDLAESAADVAFIAGSSQESEMIARILESDPELLMPPPETGKEILPGELAILRRWIDEGAKYEPYWAYATPKQVAIPAPVSVQDVHQVQPAAGPIDRLVRFQLQAEGLAPAARATRRDQLRRLSLDLTGLPANDQQVQAFAGDPSPGAYQLQVDRLLSSPAFGERLAEYWLDLVRFADTVGYHGDQTHNVAPYRDYVIDAFNDGKPLDQFSREQLAGDLLDAPTVEQQIATAYNRLLQTSHEGGVQPKEYLAIYSADRVRNFSAVWMAATVGCAQCHDHKYDPYTAQDFYALASFFADVDEQAHFKNGTNSLPTRRDPEINVLDRTDRYRLAELDRRMASLDADSPLLSALKAEREQVAKRTVRTMITKAVTPREIRLLPRGDWLDDSGDVLQPAIPTFMGDIRKSAGLSADQRPNRLHLANWLFDTQNGIGGLTARVFANRLWYQYTGRGLSPSLGDFGGQGVPPSNPELLDYLANRLIESNWDIKVVVREIVTSETYRQRVVMDADLQKLDPYNDHIASQSGHRLPAETVRDLVLSVSGMLDRTIGGTSVKPFQPAGYYRHLNFPTRRYKPDGGAMLWRRGVYTHWQRQFLHPTMKALDAPSREECTAQRARSNTPLEALALLNDPTFVVAAQSLAAHVMQDVPIQPEGNAAAIDQLFRAALARDANEIEQQTLAKYWLAERTRYQGNPAAALENLKLSESLSLPWPAESTPAQRAAFSSVCRVVLNLHETLYRP